MMVVDKNMRLYGNWIPKQSAVLFPGIHPVSPSSDVWKCALMFTRASWTFSRTSSTSKLNVFCWHGTLGFHMPNPYFDVQKRIPEVVVKILADKELNLVWVEMESKIERWIVWAVNWLLSVMVLGIQGTFSWKNTLWITQNTLTGTRTLSGLECIVFFRELEDMAGGRRLGYLT